MSQDCYQRQFAVGNICFSWCKSDHGLSNREFLTY